MAPGKGARRKPKNTPVEDPGENLVEATEAGTDPGLEWLDSPELPSASELRSAEYDQQPALQEGDFNRLEGPWDSKEVYLRTHYKLLREDAIRPLRDALRHVLSLTDIKEDERHATIGIYDSVYITGVTFSLRGIAIRVSFSLRYVGKKILWKQSKRLLAGSLVVLTVKGDRSALKVATVAARPIAGLEQNPAEIDLFFARPEDLELDPSREWIMIEERSGYYEAERHTLLALQQMSRERFPLAEYLVNLQPEIASPAYLQRPPQNLASTFPSMDTSQVDAAQRILTKSLAIVQGPPGCGKTYVSVEALKLMLANSGFADPPIILTCQTNHALDQLLRHVYAFEPELVRLGGRSMDPEIKKRTLFEVRNAMPKTSGHGGRSASKALKAKAISLMELLEPLKSNSDLINHNVFKKLGILSEAQCESLEKGDEGWVHHGDTTEAPNPLKSWLGKALVKVKPKAAPLDFGFEYEELDLGFEEIKEADAEATIGDGDDSLEELKGDFVPLGSTWTGSGAEGTSTSAIANLLRQNKDLGKIRPALRGAVFRYLMRQVRAEILKQFRMDAVGYAKGVVQRNLGNWEGDAALLKTMKVIGMTTTGFSKYRGLLNKLAPKVVLIEEAGETLEAPVIATCLQSLEQLILVGDHKQLRPHCHVSRLEGPPWNMNVSLFERLIMNGMDFSLLQRQRRMIPKIRRLLTPIYGDVITDHPVVLSAEHRPPVPGMGKASTWFWTHDAPEDRDDLMSSFNMKEAEMIGATVLYLILNGVQAKDITILTFYNGQRRKINQVLRKNLNLVDRLMGLKTPTVDSYQGEENAFVLLSLVRSNVNNKIGFLSIDNRVCVALSRAQRGFYLFGNAQVLASESKTWIAVITIMWGAEPDKTGKRPPRRIGYHLPIYCEKHKRKSWIENPDDWRLNVGGCDIPCGETLSCGHICPLHCHPFSHEQYICRFKCNRQLPCGHSCAVACGELCVCKACHSKATKIIRVKARGTVSHSPSASSASEWGEYGRGGAAMEDEKMIRDEGARLQLLRLDVENSKMLFGEALNDDADFAFGSMEGRDIPPAALPAPSLPPGPVLTHRFLVKENDGGRKQVWKHSGAAPVPVLEDIGESDWSEKVPEKSLLDED